MSIPFIVFSVLFLNTIMLPSRESKPTEHGPFSLSLCSMLVAVRKSWKYSMDPICIRALCSLSITRFIF